MCSIDKFKPQIICKCEFCGDGIYKGQFDVYKDVNGHYCSIECLLAGYGAVPVIGEMISCEYCGMECLSPKGYRVESEDLDFCDLECFMTYYEIEKGDE